MEHIPAALLVQRCPLIIIMTPWLRQRHHYHNLCLTCASKELKQYSIEQYYYYELLSIIKLNTDGTNHCDIVMNTELCCQL